MPLAALSITKCSISESRKQRRKYLSYKMSNCFPNLFQFPTTSRMVSEKTISFCTNKIHIQLFIFKTFFLWECIIKGMFRVILRLFASDPSKTSFVATVYLSFFFFKFFVNQISHNSIYSEKNTESWVYFIHFLGIRCWCPPKEQLKEK